MTQFLTKNQSDFKRFCIECLRARAIGRIEAPNGCGLEFAIQDLKSKASYIKIIHADCLESRSIRTIMVRLLRDAMNVRFSNLNFQSANLDQLIRVVIDRMKTDLTNDTIIIIDHISILNCSQIEYLVKFLQYHHLKLKCGIVLRTTTEHRLKLRKYYSHLHEQLYEKLTQDKRLIVSRNTAEEMEIFIRQIHGVTNDTFVMDLKKLNPGFSKTLVYINRYKEIERGVVSQEFGGVE